MAWQVEYLQNQEIILVKNTGELTYQDFDEHIGEVAALSKANNVFQILSDNTEMITDLGTLAIYSFPTLYEEAGLSRRSKIAVLISPEDRGIDDFKFYETVCQNNGYRSKIFFQYEDALEWLKG